MSLVTMLLVGATTGRSGTVLVVLVFEVMSVGMLVVLVFEEVAALLAKGGALTVGSLSETALRREATPMLEREVVVLVVEVLTVLVVV